MSCEDIQARLADDVLGEATDHEELARHVESCPVCAAERAAFAEAIALLREMDWPVVEPVLAAPQRERVEKRASEPKGIAWAPALRVAAVVAGLAAVITLIAVPSLLRARLGDSAEDLPRTFESRAELRYAPPVTSAAAPPPGTQYSNEHASRLASNGYLAMRVPAADAPAVGTEGGVAGGVVGGVPGGAVGGRSAWQMAQQGPADMYFERKGTNPFVPTERDALSTFGLDVDTASYSLTRNYLLRGTLPPPEAVRVEEFVNAVAQDYAAPRDGTFAIHLEGAPHPFRRGEHLLRVGIKAREVRARDRKPANLTFVIDVSGSMAAENRLGLVKRSLRLLVDRLDERDHIGIVVYGSRGRVVLEPTPASERGTLVRAIDSLQPEGSTNLDEGLDLGYRLALETADPRANNRVILCTDGVANNGITDPNALLARIHAQSAKRVFLTALGFGMGNYNDALLQKLADEGDGEYAYIDDDVEAERFFLRNLSGVLETVAREAKAQVEFDPSAVERYRLLGYEKRDVADEDFRNDEVDGGEVGAGHTVTALYELKLHGLAERLGSVTVRYVDPETHQPDEARVEIRAAQFRDAFDFTTPGFRVTALAARFAEHLRGSRWVKDERLADVLAAGDALPGTKRREPEVQELLDLVQRADRLMSAQRPSRIR